VEPEAPVVGTPACDGPVCPKNPAVRSPVFDVAACAASLGAEGSEALPAGGAVVAGPLPGTPGMGSKAAGGMGPPANPTANRQVYPHKAATTAIVSRRQVLRRRPELSTKTGEDDAGSLSEPAPSAAPLYSGPGTPLDGAEVVDVCTGPDLILTALFLNENGLAPTRAEEEAQSNTLALHLHRHRSPTVTMP